MFEGAPTQPNPTQNTQQTMSLFPSNKRNKIETLEYPQKIAFPSRSLIQSLYEEAIQCSDQQTTTKNNKDDSIGTTTTNDQIYLQDAGLLSLEQVILPAMAYQEEQALKQLQSIVQRDCPIYTDVIQQIRKAIYTATKAACGAVRDNAVQRQQVQHQREQEWWKQQRTMETKKQQEEKQKVGHMKEERKRELQKQLPANKEIWLELSYLMDQSNKLAAEEQQWRDVEHYLQQQEDLFKEQQGKGTDTSKDPKIDTFTTSTMVADISADEPEEIQALPPTNNNNQNTVSVPETEQFLEMASEVQVSSIRIQNALRRVGEIMTQTESVRQTLYEQYVNEHQFHGYQGVHNPKGLLKALSQSQGADD